jgi:site-specific recombinase XerD
MNAIGQYAYVLPTGFYPYKSGFTAYVFSDSELSALFTAIDSLPNNAKNNEALVAPVLFRLIYTCGLRPNEGRELKRKNIELDTGEIYVTNTKKKKDRLVVMSPDMLNLCREFDDPLSPEREYFFPQLSGKLYIPKQRSGSPHTQKAYKTAIDDLFDFVKEKKKLQFADITFEIINSSTLSEFLDSIEAKGNSIATRNHRLACIRAFYKYVAKIEPLAVPFRAEIMKVPMKKSATSVVINYMSEAEVKSV